MWQGNSGDVTMLIPVIDRLRGRFAMVRVCIVAEQDNLLSRTGVNAVFGAGQDRNKDAARPRRCQALSPIKAGMKVNFTLIPGANGSWVFDTLKPAGRN
jgi:hypothetical protein